MPGTTITGNILLSRQLRRQHDAARSASVDLVWDSPDILPRDAWLRRTWQECAWDDPTSTPVLLTRWQELTLWEEAIESAAHDVLLNSHATASVAMDAWKLLHAWEALHDFSAFDASLDSFEDSGVFFAWMTHVKQRLQDRDWITTAELPGALLKGALRTRFASAANRESAPLTLAGFDEITPADRRLFDALGAQEAAIASVQSHVSRAVCHDAGDELIRAAVWARRKLEAQPGARIGIVVPGLMQVAAMAERIFDDTLHPAFGFSGGRRAFAVSAGESLADTQMISAALLLLRLIDGLPREEAAMIWRSPFLGLDPDEGARLDVELRRRSVESASLRLDSVQRRLPELAAAASTAPARSRPSRWGALFSRLLKLAGWPGQRSLTPAEARTLESWKDLLSEFARLDTVLDSISRGDAISRLARMAAASRIALDDETAPVQILDIPETAGLRFEALWIAGLHAGAWPQQAKPNPFLPRGLQRRAGMPRSSADREFAFAKRATERLFTSATEVVCSFPSHASDEEQQASPFIAGLHLLPELPPADTVARRVFARAPVLESRPAEESLALPQGTLQRGGTRVLADQSACPFRAFAVHRLHAREMDDLDVGLSALERGSLVHKALELLWENLQTQQRLKALTPEEAASLIAYSVDSALAEHVAKQEPSPALEQFRRLEQARLEGLIRDWLEVELKRPRFEVVQRERARTVSVEGLNLDIRVDRIDRYEDGTHAIIDYKTSKKLSTDMWSGERPEQPQLPLYATTSGVEVAEVAFAQLTTGSAEWIGERGDALRGHLPHWEAVVRRLAGDFLSGRAEVGPREKPSPCELCKLGALCRMREMRLPPRGEDRAGAVRSQDLNDE